MILKLSQIRIDGDTQVRVAIDQATVNEYAELLESGVKLPPPTVYQDGADYWLVDGFHRYHAARKAGLIGIECAVQEGTVAEARWAAIGANKAHGLRRTNADKRKAVELALQLRPELGNEVIGEHAGVSARMVFDVRKELEQVRKVSGPDHRIGKDGKTYPVKDYGPPPTRIPDGNAPPEATEPEAKDKKGKPIPPETLPLWNRRQEVKDLLRKISEVRVTLKKAQDDADPLYAGGFLGTKMGITPVNFSDAGGHLDQAYAALKEALPEYICPMCRGISGCRTCSGNGLISDFRWSTVIPREFK